MKQVLDFVKKNWYPIILTVSSFLIGVEVIGTWAGFGVPFTLVFGYVVYVKIIK